jgi:osmotically-inducible protein OsmY
MMKPLPSDEALRTAVVQELRDDPEVVITTHISVTAEDGAVTLGGHVQTYHEKHEAVRAAEGVEGVRVVADEIEVREPSLHERSDDEIAEEIARLRGLHIGDTDSVRVHVSGGHVFLHGHIDSEAQRAAIEREARGLTGVRAVTNSIEIEPTTGSGTELPSW